MRLLLPIRKAIYFRSENRRIAAIENAIATIREHIVKTRARKMTNYQRVHNVALYLALFERDVAILRTEAAFSTPGWKQNFVARQLAILLYEASHDMVDILGKDFRHNLQSISRDSEIVSRLNGISKQFNAFKNDNQELLHTLRNFVGAHRDRDAEKQLQIIEGVDLLQILKLAERFYIPLRELMEFLTNTMLGMADWRVLIKNMPELGAT
jgi:hypothetical protein